MKCKIFVMIMMILISSSFVLAEPIATGGIQPSGFEGGDQIGGSFSGPQYTTPGSYRGFTQSQASVYWPNIFNQQKCEASDDFLMYITPGGCSPSVVRSDLLEEQNVPIFCNVDVIKLNPLIDVSRLRSVKFKGKYGKEIAGVTFHPNDEAIRSQKGYIDKPLINNAGYVVVVLKRVERESDMPDSVKVNLTGVLRYDAENAFGAGQSFYYLSIDDEWGVGDNYRQDSFFKGRGYLKLESLESNRARVSVYGDRDTKLTSFDLQKGQTSAVHYMPGFYCKAGIKLKLEDVKAGENRVLLEIDGNRQWLVEKEKFLKNKCRISKINKDNNEVTIICGSKTETLGLGKEFSEKQASENEEEGEEKEKKVYENKPLTELQQKVYDKAEEYAEYIQDEYGDIGENNKIYSAEALMQLGDLAESLNQSLDAKEIFSDIVNDYQGTTYASEALEKLDGINLPSVDFKGINIKLLQVKTPGKEELSAEFLVGGKPKVLQEEGVFSGFKLKNIYEDRVKLQYGDEEFELQSGRATTKGEGDDKVEIKLTKINLKKIAKVSVISQIPNQVAEADFNFEVGIEKRAIKLSPEKTQERIDDLNKQIEKFENIVSRLGNVVKGMKAACFATSAAITVKNFFTGLGGGSSARQKIMPEWYARCEREAEGSSRAEFNACLKKYEKNIEQDIKTYSGVLETFNKDLIQMQKDSKDDKGVVDRDKVKAELSSKYGNYLIGVDTEKASLTDLRDIIFNKQIIASNLDETSKQTAENKVESIIDRLADTDADKELYSGGDGNSLTWVNQVQPKFYLREPNEGRVYLAPIPRSYNGKTGFYVVVPEDGYTKAGDIKEFRIQNIGSNEAREISDDQKTYVDYNDVYNKNSDINILNMGKDSRSLVRDAVNVIKQANENSGRNKFNLLGHPVTVDLSGEQDQTRCQDFMSPGDCSLLFNVCDPVVCPSSRCDLGGTYRVDDVIQSGIIGSSVLCLPNIGEVAVPVCLSGIHAGLDAYTGILKSYRDCLKENLETGKTVGICDEIHSIYLCDFFWRQIAPFLDNLVVSMMNTAHGQGMKGGGEYLTVQDSWDQAEASVNYLKNDYAANSYKAFNIRSTQDVGTEFCKSFSSVQVPNKGFFDNLIEPDSPVQYHAWFDEIPYSTATVPATSQYKVFYYIWSGKDIGSNYQVYLKDPAQSAYTHVQQTIVVHTGYIERGGYLSETRDFTAPAGYKQLCVRINGKDECGFKKVSTSFALDMASNAYYADQVAKMDIKTKEECMTGSPSAYSLINPNIQAGAQEVLTPELQKKGVVRVCSSTNPGQQAEPTRWLSVGSCDDKSVTCWLDTRSVKDVIEGINLENEILLGGDTKVIDDPSLWDRDKVGEQFEIIEKYIEIISDSIKKASNKNKEVQTIRDSPLLEENINILTKVEEKAQLQPDKARAVFFKFRIYETLAMGLVGIKEMDKDVPPEDKPGEDSDAVKTDAQKAQENPEDYIYRVRQQSNYVFFRYFPTGRWQVAVSRNEDFNENLNFYDDNIFYDVTNKKWKTGSEGLEYLRETYDEIEYIWNPRVLV